MIKTVREFRMWRAQFCYSSKGKKAMDKIDYYSDMAINELNNFPDTDYKAALVSTVKFNIEREY